MRNLRHRRVSLGGDGITIKLEVRSMLSSVGEMHRRDIGDDVGDVGGDAGGEAGGEASKETVLLCDDVPFSCCPVELE